MRTNLTQTLLGKEAFKTREISYLPDYLSGTANDLMAYEQNFGITRTIYGNGYTRLSQKATAFGAGEGEAGNGAGAGSLTGAGNAAGTAIPQGILPVRTSTGAATPETLIGTEVIGKTYFQPDIYGSPLFAANEQGQVLRYAERNIWGGLKLPVHNDLNISGIEDSLRFTSYAYDPVIGKYFAQARFYDSRQGRMLSKDPVKRDVNGYPYCNNDPVNCVDPTGEVANVLAGGAIGFLVGGAFGYANSAVSQLMSGKGFDSGKAWGAAFNGAIVGAVKGAVAGSGVGLPLAIAADFAAGTIGSAVEQGIGEGVVDAGKSIAGGLTNAVNGLIYGNDTLKSLGEAAVKGAASGALTSGINYLADVTSPQPTARRSPGIQYQGGAAGILRLRDPRRGCVPSDPSIGSLRYGRDYGYQYNVPVSNEDVQNRKGFSLCDFMKEMLTGAVTGGMAGATFYGAGRAVSALKESIKGAYINRYKEDMIVASPSLIQKGQGYELKEAAGRLQPVEGFTDVAVHGNPNSFGVMHNGKWEYIDQRSMATYLKNNPEYNGGAIRLISCSTGAKVNGIAQNLSNKLGVNVLAPSDTLYIHPNNTMTIGSNPFQNTGTWNLFIPGKH